MSSPRSGAMPTLRDVAAASQVSESTVSKIVNGTKRFSPDVETRVQAAIARLGYTANPHARSVITGKTHAIGVVLADLLNPHFALVIKGINSVARARGYTVLLADSEESVSFEAELLRELVPRVDGLIVTSRLPRDVIEHYAALRPVVSTGLRPLRGVQSVGADAYQVGLLVGQYLVGSGHRRVGYVHLDQGDHSRVRGLQAAFAGQDVHLEVHLSADPSIEGGVRAATEVLLGAVRPDAVVGYNDLMALGLSAEAQKFGLSVPHDLSVVGVDDIPFASLGSPPLTTVNLHSRDIGVQAAQGLIDRIEQRPDAPRPPLTPQLVVRGSSAPRARPGPERP